MWPPRASTGSRPGGRHVLAISLNALEFPLANLGRHEQALAPAQEAVTIYRRLAETDPDTHLYFLAGALNTLAIRLAEAGRHEQALSPAQEAADHYRHLAQVWPDRYDSDAEAAAALLNGLAPS